MDFASQKLLPILTPWTADISHDIKVVDLGCGAGELLYTLKKIGFSDLNGCDLSPEQVAVAQKHFPNVVEQDLFTYIKTIEDNSVGLFLLFDVVEHLTKQATFDLMSIIQKKLKNRGRLIIHMPNGLSPFVGHVFWGDMTHEWCLTPQSAATLCALHGFDQFQVIEHLGASVSVKGIIRKCLWFFVKKGFQLINVIETGSPGGNTWTRNFAFKADKL